MVRLVLKGLVLLAVGAAKQEELVLLPVGVGNL